MELRQLRYFTRVCELGSLGRAAVDMGVAVSAVSQQVSRLESELATRLLHRSATGVRPTEAGVAFLRQARLTLRHADEAARAARQARLSGHVNIGLASTTASLLGVPLIEAMRERYPEVRLHLVEALSGHLGAMLNARQLDLAVLFGTDAAHRWHVTPLLDEPLYLIAPPQWPGWAALGPVAKNATTVKLKALAGLPLILPSAGHGLRALIDAAFARAGAAPRIVAEIDGLSLLMDSVRAGHGATLQPGAAALRAAPLAQGPLVQRRIGDAKALRRNLLASLSEEELSPAALAARVVMADVARTLVRAGRWPGATLHEN